MMVKNLSCNPTQEEIAWGRPLDGDAQSHILACPRCQETALHFATLESALDATLAGEVPDFFADRVMRRIEKGAPLSLESWIAAKFQLPLRLQAAYLCGVALVLFAFLLPSAA